MLSKNDKDGEVYSPLPGIIIREGTFNDLYRCLGLLKDGFPHWYRRIPYLFFKTFVAEKERRVIGFVSIPLHKGWGEIGLISVLDSERNKGIASTLLQTALTYLKQCNIPQCRAKVRPTNLSAQKLFQNMGFTFLATLRRPLLGDIHLVEKKILTKGD